MEDAGRTARQDDSRGEGNMLGRGDWFEEDREVRQTGRSDSSGQEWL